MPGWVEAGLVSAAPEEGSLCLWLEERLQDSCRGGRRVQGPYAEHTPSLAFGYTGSHLQSQPSASTVRKQAQQHTLRVSGYLPTRPLQGDGFKVKFLHVSFALDLWPCHLMSEPSVLSALTLKVFLRVHLCSLHTGFPPGDQKEVGEGGGVSHPSALICP